MKLRIVSTVVWFLAGWALVGGIAVLLGLNQAAGPLVGVAWAVFVMVDPKDLLWHVGKRSARAMGGLVPADGAPDTRISSGL
jgi:hypothetical protein